MKRYRVEFSKWLGNGFSDAETIDHLDDDTISAEQ